MIDMKDDLSKEFDEKFKFTDSNIDNKIGFCIRVDKQHRYRNWKSLTPKRARQELLRFIKKQIKKKI